LNDSAQEITNPLGIPSGVLVIGIIIVLLLVMVKK